LPDNRASLWITETHGLPEVFLVNNQACFRAGTLDMNVRPAAQAPHAVKSAPKPAPELPRRVAVLYGALGLFIFVTFFGVLWSLGDLIIARNSYLALSAVASLLVDFWGVVAGAAFLGVALNPLHWTNGKRLVIGCSMLAMMVGVLGAAMLHNIAFAVLGFFISGNVYNPMLGSDVVAVAASAGFFLMPLVLLALGALGMISIATIAGVLFTFLVGAPIVLFNQIFQFERMVTIYRHQEKDLAGYIARFVFWLRNEPMPETPPDDSKGARFATANEIRALYKNWPESMAFGHLGRPVFLKTDKHVLIMASTRSGKGVSLIIPHLLRYEGSAFVLDPKGENAKATGRTRAVLNDVVHVLDPFGITGKPQSRFNPLSRGGRATIARGADPVRVPVAEHSA